MSLKIVQNKTCLFGKIKAKFPQCSFVATLKNLMLCSAPLKSAVQKSLPRTAIWTSRVNSCGVLFVFRSFLDILRNSGVMQFAQKKALSTASNVKQRDNSENPARELSVAAHSPEYAIKLPVLQVG